jgi:hypothetical protein
MTAVLILALYFAPTIVAMCRRVTNTGSVVVVNLFLGWTLIGWVVALAMACRTERMEPIETSRRREVVPRSLGPIAEGRRCREVLRQLDARDAKREAKR